jgi:hypothetical protein
MRIACSVLGVVAPESRQLERTGDDAVPRAVSNGMLEQVSVYSKSE